MSCTRPLTAQSYLCPVTFTQAIRFRNFEGEPNLELPCNKCPSCKLRKAKEWALRCWHESQMHDASCAITLTYEDKHMPDYENLDHRDFQLFIKRLRKKICLYTTDREGESVCANPISYFMCGEYGDKTHRPHYHVILYGHYPSDAEYIYTKNGHRYFKSETLLKLWKKGFADFTNVSYQNSGYIARYTLKKQLPNEDTQDRYTYLDSNDELQTRKFEYIRMSTDPAIGLKWIQKYADQTIQNDYVLDPNGYQCPVPRYYVDYLSDYVCCETAAKNKQARIEKARANPDNSPERLKQKAICTEAKLKQLIRPYL